MEKILEVVTFFLWCEVILFMVCGLSVVFLLIDRYINSKKGGDKNE